MEGSKLYLLIRGPLSVPIENMPEISFHAMAGATHPRTLRLQGVLKNREVTVLIDGRSTHNFIDQSIVYSLGLPVVRDRTFQVMVGNRETISCSGRCLSLTLGIQNQRVQADFYVLPVAACPIVLGVQWLETLGPVEMDYKKLTMRFIHRGRPCSFQGLDKFGLEPLGDTELLHISGMGYFLQITSVPVDQSSNQAPMPSDLSSLLAQYAEVFAVPIGLPPQRPHDHRIPLLADHQPVNVRPYRYPHYQKAEIERMVQEFLASGIIRPSTSPFLLQYF